MQPLHAYQEGGRLSPVTSNTRAAICSAAIFICCVVPAAFAATNMTPVTVTGFNRDIVIESTASGPPYAGFALELNPGEGTCFYQSGLTGKTRGLPASGAFVNTNDGTGFQFQDYTANNALVMSSETGINNGTLFLATPAIYDQIAILANSGNGTAAGTASLVFHFNDGTTFVTNYFAPDWFNNNSTANYTVALRNTDRISITTGATSGGGNQNNPRFYETSISLSNVLGNANKPISSISFNQAIGSLANGLAGATAVYAVSGISNTSQPSLTFTPAAIANLPASGITTTNAVANGQVTSTGNDAPFITLYYGTTDGGTDPNSWQNSVPLGWQAGAFAKTISGLPFNTTYYYTFQAVNIAGTTWSSPSASFTTLTPAPATLITLPATAITTSSAALSGQVLSIGGDPPTITLFYGSSNGGTNPLAWANSTTLGVQGGGFAQGVFGLATNTGYYFIFRAVNGGGASWGAPAQSFTTLVTNPGIQPVAVLTHHNDNNRSGDNLNESLLNAGNVNSNTFGLIYTRPVDDQIYAQPLVMTNVSIPGQGTHNILYVCTVNDTIYAYDADDGTVTSPYWQTNFTGTFGGTVAVAPRNSDMTGACGGAYVDYSGNMGIVSTPVIDPASQTMWVLVRTKETSASATNFVQRLYALDITTGGQRPNSPVIIAATVNGTGAGGTTVSFDPQKNNQRSALAFANGKIYIAWSSHCDWGPYHGWVMAYDATSLLQVAAYCDTANGSQGGIWMSGQGPAIDNRGNVYVSTGNGSVDSSGTSNRALSFLQFDGASLNVKSWFTPFNYVYLNNGDYDLGSGGVLLIPGTTYAIGGGKSGSTVPATLYLVNRDNMGGLSTGGSDTNIVQSIGVTPINLGLNHIHGAPVWWDGPFASYLYVWGESDRLHQYQFDKVNGVFQLPVYSQSPTPVPVNAMTGSMLSVSANGTNAGTGILWAAHQYSGNANNAVRPGILRAFDAQNVTNELWNSQHYSARDAVGMYAKFVPPTIANGKVYLPTFSGQVNVYGLLPAGPPLIYQQPVPVTRYAGDSVTFSLAVGGSAPLSYRWYKGASPISGATNAILMLNNVQMADVASYSCVLSNGFGTLASSGAALSVIAATPVTYPQVVVADNPMGYWRLNEASGTVAHDYFGNLNGQYVNVRLGQPGYSAFDPDTAAGFGMLAAQNSYVSNITGIDFGTFNNTVTFSVEAWVNGAAQTGDNGIVTVGYGGGGEQFDLDTGGTSHRFRFLVRDAATDTAHNANSSVGPDGNWHHLVGVCDETHGYMALYVDGVSNATAAITGGVPVATTPLSIGARQSAVSPTGVYTNYDLNFVGTIDEVSVYNYALTPAQVQNHYNTGTNQAIVPFIIITNINVASRANSAIISWTTTHPATTQLSYGLTTNYENALPMDPNLTISHAVMLPGLANGAVYYFQITSTFGPDLATASGSFVVVAPVIIMTADQPSYSGVWTIDTAAPDKYGPYYKYAATSPGGDTARATFVPNIATPGVYDTYIWYSQGANRSAAVPVTVSTPGFTTQAIVDQTDNGGSWQLLAAGLPYAGGPNNFIRIGNGTGENNKVVIVDAVQLAYQAGQDVRTDGTVPDWWAAFFYGTNAVGGSSLGANGYSLYASYLMGLVPTNPASQLSVSVNSTGSALQVVISPFAYGRAYGLQSSPGIAPAVWNSIPNLPVTVNTNGQGVITFTNSGSARNFYRLSVQMTP
jgi:hypothetical protein